MNRVCVLGMLLVVLGSASLAQENAQENKHEKTFGWVRAEDAVSQLDPADYHGDRVYRPGPDGGNIHADIQSRLPITVAMAPAAEWQAQQQHPEAEIGAELFCVREHVISATFECHLPSGRPMVLLFRDERKPNHVLLTGIAEVLAHNARQFVSPNDVIVTYYNWSCVRNCRQPEFQWFYLLNEKSQLTSVPKIYSLLTPESDGQRVNIRIKSPVPMTVALLPSGLADQVYDNPGSITSALASTSCKQRGVQSLSFECTVNVADGRQSLVMIPDVAKVPHKKAEIQLQTVKCAENCDLLGK